MQRETEANRAKGRCLSSFASLDRPLVARESFPFFFTASCRRMQPIFSRSLELNVRGPIHTCKRSFSRYAIVTRFHVTAMKMKKKKKKNRTSTCTDRCFIPSLPQPLSVSFFFRGSRQVRTTRSVETVDALPSFVLCAVASICNVRARVKSRFAELGFIGEWSSRLLTALVSKDFECSTLDTAGDFLSHK